MSNSNKCWICEENLNETIDLINWRSNEDKKFEYYVCKNCGNIQIKEIPENLSDYYSDNYYSLQENYINDKQFSKIKKFLLKHRELYFFKIKKDILGFLVNVIKPNKLNQIENLSIKFLFDNMNKGIVLDVGSGNNWLWQYFHKLGWTNIIGIDPFIDNDIFINGKKVIYKSTFDEFIKNNNCNNIQAIMFNHSLEHIANPIETIKLAHSILPSNGKCFIGLPINNGLAKKIWGYTSISFDVPIHLWIPSLYSLFFLKEKSNFYVKEFYSDYNIDIFLMSYVINKNILFSNNGSFTKKQKFFCKKLANLSSNLILSDFISLILEKK